MALTIIHPIELAAALQSSLQGVPELVSLLGGKAENILLYEREGDLAAAIENLVPGSILLYFDGIQPARSPSRFKYMVSAAIRSKDPGAVFQTVMQGVSIIPSSDGLSILCSTIHPRFHPMDLPTLERQQISGAGGRVFEIFVLRTGFTDKGSN